MILSEAMIAKSLAKDLERINAPKEILEKAYTEVGNAIHLERLLNEKLLRHLEYPHIKVLKREKLTNLYPLNLDDGMLAGYLVLHPEYLKKPEELAKIFGMKTYRVVEGLEELKKIDCLPRL